MSTSKGDSRENVALNRQLFLDEFSLSEVALAQPVQVSRDGIMIVDAPGKYPECDALITRHPNVFLSVLTADCSPVLIWSEDYPLVAAVHSGWQGSELDILGRTLIIIKDSFDISPDKLNMIIGPGLSQEYFEVGPEFNDKFPAEYLHPVPDTDRFKFDNNNYLQETAIKQGVPESQIEMLDYCSYRDDDLFFSHRRDKNITGRMMSLIGIRG